MHSVRSVLKNPRLAATAVIALGGIVTYMVNFPGSMEDDSFVQLVEGRTGSYEFWHPPIMSWMLGVSDSLIGPADAWFTLFEMVVAFGALAAVVWLPRRTSWKAVVCAAAMLFLPQLFMLQAVVWKDALFANAMLAAFVLMAHAAARGERARLRFGLLIASAAFLALAMLTRQNGFAVLPCAVAGLWIAAAKREGRARVGVVYAAVLLISSVGLALGVNALLELRSDGTPAQREQIKILRLYDITGMVNRDLDLPLTVLDREAPRLARLIRTEGVARWSPLKNDTLQLSPRIVEALDDTPADVLAQQWRSLIIHHPGDYLAVRALLFRWVFQPPNVGLCHPFHVGDEGDPADLRTLGMQPRLDRRDVALWHYGDFFEFYTPVFSHGLWAVVCLIVLVPLLRRRNPVDMVMASLIAGTALFAASFFVISIACDYRYLYIIDLTALAGVLYVAADWESLKTTLMRES